MTEDIKSPELPKCAGCGRVHGPVQAEIACLTKHLYEEKGKNVHLQKVVDDLQQKK